jgi:hypothetical protein
MNHLISASHAARIIGMTHQPLAKINNLITVRDMTKVTMHYIILKHSRKEVFI